MGLDSAPAHADRVAPATWGAVSALILLLAALSLLLIGCDLVFKLDQVEVCPDGIIEVDESGAQTCRDRVPNHYTCECRCEQGFAIGARITPTITNLNVRATPAGTIVGQVSTGTQGTIVAGPQQADLNGVSETWWQVDFDGSAPDGWVVQSLTEVIITYPAVVKDLEACLPPGFNANLEGGVTPSPDQLEMDCAERIAPHVAALTQADFPPGSVCTCDAKTVPATWDASCDADCTDPTGVCLLAGSDPPQPTPDPLPRALFSTTSVCEVTGQAEIHIGDEVKLTSVTGLLQVHGQPCVAGESCHVGISYQLSLGDIEIPVRFHSDPRFVGLHISGASEPQAVELVPFIGPLYAGQVPTGATLNSARGKRSTWAEHLVLVGRNGSPLSFAVDWVNKRCLLDGDFINNAGAGVVDDDGDTQPIHILLTIGGQTDALSRLVNQPPRADAGADQTVECTSPAGATVNLSAAASTDGDGNISFFTWRAGSPDGPHVVPPSATPTATTQQAIGETTYHLRAVDTRLAAGTDSVTVRIADTTAPTIDCQAPATLPKHETPVAFRATATDTCGAPPAVVIEAFECFKEAPAGREIDNPSCEIAIQGDTLRIEKRGGSDVIRWRMRATDAAGNVGRTTCEVRVEK